jgi:hypothetical protein
LTRGGKAHLASVRISCGDIEIERFTLPAIDACP